MSKDQRLIRKGVRLRGLSDAPLIPAGFQWILEECKLAGGPANIAIPGIAHSGGMEAFWN